MSLLNQKKEFDLRQMLNPYINSWKLYLIFFLFCLLLSLLFLRYATPEFEAKAKIQIISDENKVGELGAFKDLGVLDGLSDSKIEDEIEILNSRSNFINVVKLLNLNYKIESVGRISNSELYKKSPFNINFLSSDSLIYNSKFTFDIKIISGTSFVYINPEDANHEEIFYFGSQFSCGDVELILTPLKKDMNGYVDQVFRISVNPLNVTAELLQKKIILSVQNEFSSIVSLTLRDPINIKSIDIINKLIDLYNENALEDKRKIAVKTSEFINDRITDIYNELNSVDQTAVNFKSNRGITDLTSQSNLNLTVGSQNQQELRLTENQLYMALSMKDLIDSQESFDVLPSNIGLTDPTISNTINKYNEMVLERNRLLENSNPKNPIVVNLDQQLDGLKQSLNTTIEGVTNNLSIQLNSLNNQISRINSKIYSAPKNEKALRDIARRQETTESLYLYLLQKREESQIAFASSSQKSKIIDSAYAKSQLPVYPKKTFVFLITFVLGISLPTIFIYIKNLLDNKIHNKRDLEKIVDNNIPIIGELPSVTQVAQKLVQDNDRSALAEALRILRTNLDYILKLQNIQSYGKVIFVTSSISGEGKTFTSSNLAKIISNANKKVVLVGGDIRNPKIQQYFPFPDLNIEQNKSKKSKIIGLSDYLISDEYNLDDIITKTSNINIDIIHSGKLMPNPSELLMSERLGKLFEALRDQFDYIIVDTAPMLLVSDTLNITKYADQIIYLVRADHTEVKLLEFPLSLREEGKLTNFSFVVIDVKEKNLGYGGKYGYGYKQKTDVQNIFTKITKRSS